MKSNWLTRSWSDLLLAISFFTTIPVQVPPSDLSSLGRTAFWLPWVGLLLGALLAGLSWLGSLLFPPLITCVLVVVLWAGATGFLHLDGLADCYDGLLASVSRERRLEIMKDPRLGTFGGVGLTLHLIVKIGCLLSLSQPYGLLLAPVLARWANIWMCFQPQARPGGLGAAFASAKTPKTMILSSLLPIGLALAGGIKGILALLATLLVLAVITRLARQRLGGVTGDVMGLTIEMCEAVVLLIFTLTLPWAGGGL